MNYKFKIMRNSIAILFLSLLFAGCQSADLEQMDLRPLMEEHAITGIQAVFAQEKPLSKNYNEEYFINIVRSTGDHFLNKGNDIAPLKK